MKTLHVPPAINSKMFFVLICFDYADVVDTGILVHDWNYHKVDTFIFKISFLLWST